MLTNNINLENTLYMNLIGGKFVIQADKDPTTMHFNVKSSENQIICNIKERKKVQLFTEIINQAKIVLEFEFNLHDESELEVVCLVKNCDNVTLSIKAVSIGENSSLNINNICHIKGKNEIKIHTIQEHIAPNSHSTVTNTAVLEEWAKINIKGMINVGKNANNSTSSQYTKSILLSDHAHAEISPNLNISANDIICNHGATTGNFDPISIYYIKSRGISQKVAENMLTMGVITAVFDGLKGTFWSNIVKKNGN